MDPSSPPLPPKPVQPIASVGNKAATPWIITSVLLGLLLIASGIVLAYYQPWKTPEEEGTDNADAEEEDSEEEDNETEDADEPEDGDTEEDEDDVEDDEGDMTELWNEYHSGTYYFGLKYPKDLVYTENGTLATSGFSATFGVGSITAFTAWMVSADSGTSEQTVADLRISNQCTDSITYGTYDAGDYTFTRATEVPNQTCLTMLGVNRTIPLEAFVWKIDPTTFFVLVNEGMNSEQLPALLSTIYFG